MNGHWFCNRCDEVVFKPAPVGRWDMTHDAFCPQCGHQTADYKQDALNGHPKHLSLEPSSKTAELFRLMKEAL